MLEPKEEMKKLEENFGYTKRLALTEEFKAMPWADVYDYYCYRNHVSTGADWLRDVEAYEKDVLSLRK